MELRWAISAAASGPYAVGQLLRGAELVDAPLADRLAKPVAWLRDYCLASGVDPLGLADQLTGLAVEPSSLNSQVSLAIRKTAGESCVASMAGAVARWTAEVQMHFCEVHPQALHELEVRSAPLAEQWEARGPGLLGQLRQLVGKDYFVESALVTLVQPVLGGGGLTHVAGNRVTFEAVLTNPAPQIPETLRLGWLLAQLHLDLPVLQGNLAPQRALQVGAAGFAVATLAAGHEVELCAPSEVCLSQALAAWRLKDADGETLSAWWETYHGGDQPWPVALAALDQMLAAE